MTLTFVNSFGKNRVNARENRLVSKLAVTKKMTNGGQNLFQKEI